MMQKLESPLSSAISSKREEAMNVFPDPVGALNTTCFLVLASNPRFIYSLSSSTASL